MVKGFHSKALVFSWCN